MFYVQILEQSLLMFPLVLGIYVSFGVLKIADLSVDGSFVLGAAVFATLSTLGIPFFVAMMLAVLAGALSGVFCAVIQRRNRIDPLIAGILVAFILHSLSLVVMQRPNIGLLTITTIFSSAAEILPWSPLIVRLVVLLLLLGVISLGLTLFISSPYGLWLKSFGNNQNLVAMLGRNPESLRMVGLGLGNGFAALSGCLTAQASGYADINMGFGQALIGIAVILLGKEILRLIHKNSITDDAFAVVGICAGTIFYFFIINELIRIGLNPVYLKMAIGVFLISFLLLSSQRSLGKRGLS